MLQFVLQFTAVIVFNERHLQAVLAEFVSYYNQERPHRTLAMEAPLPSAP